MHRPTCLLLAFASLSSAALGQGVEDYRRAERFILRNAQHYILNGDVQHQWIGATDRLQYRRETADGGKEFVIVDARSARRTRAFDHAAVAAALSKASGVAANPKGLPFEEFRFIDGERAIEVEVAKRSWRCVLGGECTEHVQSVRRDEVVSPDGKWAVSRRNHNVWVRSLESGDERALTKDGVEDFSYGGQDFLGHLRGREPRVPVIVWSPDSKRIVVERIDDRGVRDMYFVQTIPDDGGVRPVLHSIPVAFPGEPAKNHVDSLAIIEVASGKRVEATHPSFARGIGSFIAEEDVWWSDDGRRVFVVPNEEGRKELRLLAIDAISGAIEQLIEEKSATYLDGASSMWGSKGPRTLRSGEILWYSERDDWGHLYLYDRHGVLKNQITRGKWKVRDILRVDEAARRIYFTANAREPGDPYQRFAYVVNFDGSGLRLLTPENADHDVDVDRGFSPSGRFFVDIYSRPDLPAITVLRSRDGKLVMSLEAADITPLKAGGFTMPEPFSVLAADGVTRIYGTLFRPSSFDPQRRYPVVDVVYPGPQRIQTAKSFMRGLATHATAEQGFIQSLAELGFVVLTIDGRGTPLLSKSMHDISYGNMQQAGNLEDHIAGIRQLAQRYPYLDLDRVGMYGHSSGGFAAVRALFAYGDFYKVGISSAGDHDQRGDDLGWATTYQGPFDPAKWAPTTNAPLAGGLKGKLLLVQGDLDEAVHPAVTMQLVDALIRANKDFDLLIVPNAGHEVDRHTYVIRRRWDYFVRHLLGAEPPKEYRITELATN